MRPSDFDRTILMEMPFDQEGFEFQPDFWEMAVDSLSYFTPLNRIPRRLPPPVTFSLLSPMVRTWDDQEVMRTLITFNYIPSVRRDFLPQEWYPINCAPANPYRLEFYLDLQNQVNFVPFSLMFEIMIRSYAIE